METEADEIKTAVKAHDLLVANPSLIQQHIGSLKYSRKYPNNRDRNNPLALLGLAPKLIIIIGDTFSGDFYNQKSGCHLADDSGYRFSEIPSELEVGLPG